MRMCVAGGGLAGSMLAWRLAQLSHADVDLVLGQHRAWDATDASSGMVRAYEPLAEQRQLAITSLMELLDSRVLQRWADYRQAGSVYLRDSGETLAAEVAEIERALPGSAELVPAAEAFGDTPHDRGLAAPPEGTAVLERQAGYISPSRLRDAILADLAVRPCVTLHAAALEGVEVTTAGTVRITAESLAREYDIVVLAVGAWTPAVLSANGLPPGTYRTKSIRNIVYSTGDWRPPPFVDDINGLYGKPTADGDLMLGMPTTEWDVPAGRPPETPAWHERAVQLATSCFPRLRLGVERSRMSGADCYCDPPILSLREVTDASAGPLTFTGGSGGSIKTVLAASERAATQLALHGPVLSG